MHDIHQIQEREAEGPFTFQVTLRNDGDIWFAYQKIPIEIVSIKVFLDKLS